MVLGDKSIFALESHIEEAYPRLSFRALGFFVAYVGGYRYGINSPTATLLACSFDEVQNRIAGRGKHTAPFASEPDASAIATAFRQALYAPGQENERFFGFPQPEFKSIIYSHRIKWAPDGDQAFDDGSYILQFDVENKIRLIAFKTQRESYHHDSQTLRDIWLDANTFYDVMKNWRDAFETEWRAKIAFEQS